LDTVQGEQAANEVSPMLSSKPEQQQQDQTTTPGTTFPTLCEGCVGSLTSTAITIYMCYSEDAGDGAHDFSSLSETTRMSNHLQM